MSGNQRKSQFLKVTCALGCVKKGSFNPIFELDQKFNINRYKKKFHYLKALPSLFHMLNQNVYGTGA